MDRETSLKVTEKPHLIDLKAYKTDLDRGYINKAITNPLFMTDMLWKQALINEINLGTQLLLARREIIKLWNHIDELSGH